MRNEYADLRSDTVTRPTPEMYEAMATAEVGDDVLGDDPTVKRLEETAAARFGKEAAMFTPSGTMANQAAMMAWLRPGDEVLCEAKCHVFNYEGGGVARLSGAQPRTIPGDPRPGHAGQIPLDALADTLAGFRPGNEHQPRTRLIAIENTHNLHGGAVLPLDYMREVKALADRHGLGVHLDGARIFNAMVATGVDAKTYGDLVDTVSFCLSKGLCAPVGSLLVGPRELVSEARRARKVLGGTMRQAGILAGAGLVALERMVDRLAEDHARARRLAEGLATCPYLQIDPATVETNILTVGVTAYPGDATALQAALEAEGVRCFAFGPKQLRLVTHRDVDDVHIDRALAVFRRLG